MDTRIIDSLESAPAGDGDLRGELFRGHISAGF